MYSSSVHYTSIFRITFCNVILINGLILNHNVNYFFDIRAYKVFNLIQLKLSIIIQEDTCIIKNKIFVRGLNTVQFISKT